MGLDTNGVTTRSNFWGLLVGIDDYEAVPKLRGCVNDVTAMRDFLTRNLLVPEKNIRALTSDNSDDLPTRDGIIKAIQDFLINNSDIKRGDQILFHYSGHGSQIRDTTGLEPDGYNETLVAMDSRNGQVWDIPDKTIAALLDQLIEKKGDNITIILDCCHSGSGTRKIPTEGAALIRQLPPDDRLSPTDLDADILAGAPRRQAGPSGWSTQDIPYTLLAACRDKEEASEHLAVDAETYAYTWHGAMTYFTLFAMRQMSPGISYVQLYEQVAVKVNALYPQMPQCEGKRDREVFGNSRVERDPFILVKNIDGRITVEAGLIHQIHPGDKLALYPHKIQTKADLPPKPLATIQLESVSPTQAQANIVARNETIPELSRGLVTEMIYTGQSQMVALHAAQVDENGDPLSEEQIEANQGAIVHLRGFLESHPSPYLNLLENSSQPAQLRVEATRGKYNICNAKGELLVMPEDIRGGNDISSVVNSLESIARYRAIVGLINREVGSQLVGNIEVNLRHLIDAEAKDLVPDTVDEGGELTLPFDPDHQENNLYVVDLINRSSLEVYPYVFTLNPDYSIYILYPRQGEENAIAPNNTFSIGLDHGQQPLEIYLPDGWDSSRDYLKVIVTTAPADFKILEQQGLNVPPTRSVPTRAINSPLDQLINSTVLGAGTRFGRPTQTLVGEDWATVEFPYTVTRRYQTTDLTSGDRSVMLSDGLTLEKPESFTGSVTVTTWDQAKRSVDGDTALAPPPALAIHPEFQPLGRTGVRSVGTNGLVLALEVDESSRQMITPEAPLHLRLSAVPGEEVGDFLPVIFDGEDYLPVGYGSEDGNTVEIVSLPEPKTPGKRGLARTLRLFVYKKMGRYTNLTGLRYVKHTNSIYKYDTFERDQFKTDQKIALMIHGFNSDTGWMLKTVAPFLHNEVLPYDHILTWDYETLGTTIERTGEDLAIALKQQCGFDPDDNVTLHVYTHSMGSIVARTMIELFGGHEFVDRLVVAGPPNQGTPIATTSRGGVYLLTLLLNQYSVIPPVGVLNWGIKQVYEQSLGLADLMTDSDFLRKLNRALWELNTQDEPYNVPYLVLAGENVLDEMGYNRFNRLAQKVLDSSLDLFFGEDHDLVIGLSSLGVLSKEVYPNVTTKKLTCNHFGYYDLQQARQIIKQWINS